MSGKRARAFFFPGIMMMMTTAEIGSEQSHCHIDYRYRCWNSLQLHARSLFLSHVLIFRIIAADTIAAAIIEARQCTLTCMCSFLNLLLLLLLLSCLCILKLVYHTITTIYEK